MVNFLEASTEATSMEASFTSWKLPRCLISTPSVCNFGYGADKKPCSSASNPTVVDASNLTPPAPTDAPIQKRGRKTDDNENAIAKLSFQT